MPVKKVLIVDGEEFFCLAIKKALESRGAFHVLTATRGYDGIRLAKAQKPDIILLDIMMPDMDGSEVAEKLSKSPITSSIPIIFVTTLISREEVRKSGGVVGGRNFIAKPVIIDELIKRINAI
ncbi:MAG: response regulator [Deltaproteobacteria bacterium]|jgi:DNA-binding response OmpR family regulator|nr:MAG: response regulator [Deltaproteobacteria bacterium]